MFSIIDNTAFRHGIFKNDRYPHGKLSYNNDIISNNGIFPVTFIVNNYNIKLSILKSTAFFEIGIIDKDNHNKTISLSPLVGTSTNNINKDYNIINRPNIHNRKDEMIFDLLKVKLEDIFIIKIIDNYLCYSINEQDFIKLWNIDIDNSKWLVYIYMSGSKIKVY